MTDEFDMTDELLEKIEQGCVLLPKRHSGDVGEWSRVDEDRTDDLLFEAAAEIRKLRVALKQIRDTPFAIYEPVRQIAVEALK